MLSCVQQYRMTFFTSNFDAFHYAGQHPNLFGNLTQPNIVPLAVSYSLISNIYIRCENSPSTRMYFISNIVSCCHRLVGHNNFIINHAWNSH